MMLDNHRLPGIYFQVEQQPVADTLPRMDVAGFIGIAEKGPVNIAVTIEDFKHFCDLFGTTVDLAWDNVRSCYQQSNLAVSVEQFFRNGGKRCRVVRVARESNLDKGINAAQRQTFILPHLFYKHGEELDATVVSARALGSWADNLRVGSRLNVYSLGIDQSAALSEVFEAGEDDYTLYIQTAPSDLQLHDLVDIRFDDCELRVYLFVDELEPYAGGWLLKSKHAIWLDKTESSPVENTFDGLVILNQSDALLAYESVISGSPDTGIIARRLLLDLITWQGDSFAGELLRLGFHSGHKRFWGKLPTDEVLYSDLLQEDSSSKNYDLNAVIPDAIEPRFPLSMEIEEDDVSIYIPLGMPIRINHEDSYEAVGDRVTPEYVRNGLEYFSADIFLDPELSGMRTNTLQSEAFHKRYITEQKLKGIYALLADPMVSIISVPDLSHRHWDKNTGSYTLPMNEPQQLSLATTDRYGRRKLSWSAVSGVRRYVIQHSSSATFDLYDEYYIDSPDREVMKDSQPEHQEAKNFYHFLFPAKCSSNNFFRVRAEGYGNRSPWSNTLYRRLPEKSFYGCNITGAELFTTQISKAIPLPAQSNILISWTLTVAEAVAASFDGEYQLEMATDLDFSSARIIYKGNDTAYELEAQSDELIFLRVRTVVDDISGPCSNTIYIFPESLSRHTVKSGDEYNDNDLLAVHCALLRICASDADKVAVLSLPRHYLSTDASRHVDRLLQSYDESMTSSQIRYYGTGNIKVPSLNRGEVRASSYAALFHPWIYVNTVENISSREGQHISQVCPVDGAICGQMAEVSNIRGAWIASANKHLIDSLGLDAEYQQGLLVDALDKQVNMLARRTGNNVVMQWDTLSKDTEYRSLSVRRLMTLLLRIIRREGELHVFEPNGQQLQDAVQAFWVQVLSGLYQRGALRGASQDEAFHVVTGEEVNNQHSEELGRFYVELHIAPSLPMNFIVIRLAQSTTNQIVIQEL